MGTESPAVIDIQAVLVHPDATKITPPQTSSASSSSSWSVAVPVGDDASSSSSVPMWQQEKLGGKCCGCCCDYRRAVIILAIIRLFFNAMFFAMSMAAYVFAPGTTTGSTSDRSEAGGAPMYDEVQQLEMGTSPPSPSWNDYEILLFIMAILGSTCALIGALRFNIWLLSVDLVRLVVHLIAGAVLTQHSYMEHSMQEEGFSFFHCDERPVCPTGNMFPPLIMSLFILPHIGFIMEVRNGTMSRETYPREEYSCCCTRRSRRNAFVGGNVDYEDFPTFPAIS